MNEVDILKKIKGLRNQIDAVPVQANIKKIDSKVANLQDRLLYALYTELENWESEIDPVNVFRERLK